MREFIRDPSIFGKWQAGTPTQPAATSESHHFLKKTVAGRPLTRPVWWFDRPSPGESLADVGTHTADLALSSISARSHGQLPHPGHPSPRSRPLATALTEDDFHSLTGLPGYPPHLMPLVVNGQLYYAGNNTVTYTLSGVHVKMSTHWEVEAVDGGLDAHTAIALGTLARWKCGRRPPRIEVFISATDPANHAELFRKLSTKCDLMGGRLPGLATRDAGTEIQLLIPDKLRTTHEDHFAAVMDEFVRYFHNPRAIPAWERPNTLGKYYIDKAIEMARDRD
ncbi:MAG: putative oxidoreductase C-terminal domain-containing protein [Gemmataceae bacterium]